MQNDIIGKALLDFQAGNYDEDIVTYSSLDEEDVMPLPHLFRSFDAMPKLEQLALENCQGEILDIGCGAGSHSLYLQQKGFSVTALDRSKGAIEVCEKRGLKKVVHADIMDYSEKKFDTLLLLMNGIGLVGTLANLGAFLNHAARLLNPDGFILLDSSDIIYMFETEDGEYDLSEIVQYHGEVEFSLGYKEEKSEYFKWLYVDFDTLCTWAEQSEFRCELLFKGVHHDYLAKLYPKL